MQTVESRDCRSPKRALSVCLFLATKHTGFETHAMADSLIDEISDFVEGNTAAGILDEQRENQIRIAERVR